MLRMVLAAALLVHGLIHLSWLTPAPATADGPEWPFEAGRSWLVSAAGVDPGVASTLAVMLGVLTATLFSLAALSTMGWVVPSSWWPAVASAGAVASLLMLAAFFHPWLAVGFVIDAAILWTALVAEWMPAS
jgi:hypothetical protein